MHEFTRGDPKITRIFFWRGEGQSFRLLPIGACAWLPSASFGQAASWRKGLWSLRQERSVAIQAAHPPHDGLRVPRVEVRSPHSCPEATGFTIQVSSPCYWSPLVRKKQADTRGSGCSVICRPHQSPDFEFRLKVIWCGEPPSTATRQILTLIEGWPRRLTRKRRAAGASRPVDAIARDGQVD